MRFLILALPCLLVCALPATPLPAEDETVTPIPLYGNLGSYSRPLQSSSTMAQKYFDQGMQLSYGFGREAAVRSFKEAQRHDPECAMCYWGEAWALGPYQNGKMNEENGKLAFSAIQKAVELKDKASDVDRALIEAMAARYEETPTEENREKLDLEYAGAMRDVVRRFPLDLDAATLLSESLIVLHPWDLWLEGGKPRPETAELLAVLEGVLARNIKHAGACHLYIHAVEASRDPGRGEACADLLADQMPGASHVQHMPSHIYMRIGRYGDGVRSNQKAHMMDVLAERGEAAAIYVSHNLDMLVFAAWMDGQSAIALQAARDLTHHGDRGAHQYPLMLARFGRWQEILKLEDVPEKDFDKAFWHFARGLAQVRLKDAEKARGELEALQAIAAIPPTEEEKESDSSKENQVLYNIASAILQGEMAAAQGKAEEAVSHLQEAMTSEDSLEYDEPEKWPIPARQVLGAVLLENGRLEEAERVYREELADHVENGWSLFGLEKALRAQGKAAEADLVAKRFEKAWERADLVLYASRF